tara:strand:+ start:239 stop:436 length:198 start_codon:yes stop_codon:yes gene_type:complete
MNWQETIYRNPKQRLHMPVKSKKWQIQDSKSKKETCDYCDRVPVLDCKACKQKLCKRHAEIIPCR